jgi:hypothetical protein
LLSTGTTTTSTAATAKSDGIKKRWKILGGIIVLLVILVLAGSRSSSPSRQSSGAGQANAPAAAPTRAAIGTTAENPAPFAEPLTGGGAKVQLLSGRLASEFGYSEPKGGYKYLVIETRIEGAGPDDHHFGISNFSGQDADTGAGYDSAFVLGDDTLGSDALSAGEYVTGTVALEVQETAKRVIVKYDPNKFNDEDLYWLFE